MGYISKFNLRCNILECIVLIFSLQIYPFLVLGLGTDDMFVIVGTFLEIEQKKGRNAPIKELIKDTMVTVGPSITLTSITNFAGFLICYIIPYNLFRDFVIQVFMVNKYLNNIHLILQVAIAIALNYIALVIGMPCYLIIDYYRSKGKLMDVLCCFPVCQHEDDTDKEVDKKMEEPNKTGLMTSASSWLSKASNEYNSLLTWFIVKYYSPFLQNYIVKAVCIVLFFILLAIGIWGFTLVQFDRHLTDNSADETFLEYAEINDDYFQTYAFLVATKAINYPGLQPQLLEMERRILDIDNVIAPTNGNRLWLRVMIEYFQGLNTIVCSNVSNPTVQGLVTGIVSVFNRTFFQIEPSCNSTAPQFSQECLCKYNFFTVEEFRGRNFTVIPRDQFYLYLTIWVSYACMCGACMCGACTRVCEAA